MWRQQVLVLSVLATMTAACGVSARLPVTGFVKENGDGMGRPVGVAIDKRGALLVADDVGNAVWRVTSQK